MLQQLRPSLRQPSPAAAASGDGQAAAAGERWLAAVRLPAALGAAVAAAPADGGKWTEWTTTDPRNNPSSGSSTGQQLCGVALAVCSSTAGGSKKRADNHRPPAAVALVGAVDVEGSADRAELAPDETVILLHPPLMLAGVSIVMERGCQ